MVFLLLLAFQTRNEHLTGSQQMFVIFLIFMYLISFQLSLGPIIWLYNAEILPEKGCVLATLANWSGVIVIAFFFPILVGSFGISICYVIFAICCFAGIGFIQKYVQETKGLNAYQI
jgi:major inositol transporter-like SP family MFS transporter